MKTGSSRQPVWHVAADNDITLVRPVHTCVAALCSHSTKNDKSQCQKLLEIKYICIIVMYEWQASLFDNDNLSSPLTFKTEQKTVKYPFRLKTAAPQQKPAVGKMVVSDFLCKSEWMLFLIDLSNCAILNRNRNGHYCYNVIHEKACLPISHKASCCLKMMNLQLCTNNTRKYSF